MKTRASRVLAPAEFLNDLGVTDVLDRTSPSFPYLSDTEQRFEPLPVTAFAILRAIVSLRRCYTSKTCGLLAESQRYRNKTSIKPVWRGTFQPLIWFVRDRGDLI